MTDKKEATEAGAVEIDEKDLDEIQGGADREDRYRVKVKYPWLDNKVESVSDTIASPSSSKPKGS